MTDYLLKARGRSRSSSEFVAVLEKTLTCMDQMLGYRGSDRFVIFYHEPRAQEVVWRDSHSYGLITGAWPTFMDEVAPVADHYGVDVGCNGAGVTHVLLVDRVERRAYFALRLEALQFLAQTQSCGADMNGLPIGVCRQRVPAAMVEITHQEITRLAHQIWERKGRPEGQELQNWLQAEAELKAGLSAAGVV